MSLNNPYLPFLSNFERICPKLHNFNLKPTLDVYIRPTSPTWPVSSDEYRRAMGLSSLEAH